MRLTEFKTIACLMLVFGVSPRSVAVRGQGRGPDTPTFEAATLKLQSPDDGQRGTFFTLAGGRMRLRGCTLGLLMLSAYQVQDFQILNTPAWAGEVRYDIDAVPPAGSNLANYAPSNPKLMPPDEELAMLRTLLADRFHLTVHEETKDGPAYALVLGDRPLKLDAPADKNAYSVVIYGRTDDPVATFYRQGFNVSMAKLADALSRDLKTPVVDQTGLSGAFDFKFIPESDPSDPTPGAALFAAIQQIGLKLKATKAPVRYIVVDHVEKPKLD